MAMGLVPIVVDYGGPGEIVTDETGFRVPIGTRASIVESLTSLLTKLAYGRENLAGFAINGLQRIDALYTWEKKALQLLEVYDWVTGRRDARPEFPFLSSAAAGTEEGR